MWYYTPSRCTAAPNFFLKNVLRRFGIEAASFRPTDTPVHWPARAAAVCLDSKTYSEEN